MTKTQKEILLKAFYTLEEGAAGGKQMVKSGKDHAHILKHLGLLVKLATEMHEAVSLSEGAEAVVVQIDRSKYPRAKPLSKSR